MIDFVIRIENGKPVGKPLLADNFKQIFNLKGSLNKKMVEKHGFAPFLHTDKPDPSLLEDVQDKGKALGDDGFVRPIYDVIMKDTADVDMGALREHKREQLKQERDELTYLPINNVQVGRIEDRENIQGTIAGWDTLGLGATINWIMFDNTVKALSKADLEAIYVDYGLRKAQCFNLYEQIITQLNEAQTIEDIMNVTYGYE